MVKEIINWILAYIELGIDFLMVHLLTVEGIIGLLLGVFFIGLVASLRRESTTFPLISRNNRPYIYQIDRHNTINNISRIFID